MALDVAADLLHGRLQLLKLGIPEYSPGFGRREDHQCVQKEGKGQAISMILWFELGQQYQAVGEQYFYVRDPRQAAFLEQAEGGVG